MIHIHYKAIYSTISSTDQEEMASAIRLLRKLLTVHMPGYFFSPQYKRGLWDGKKAFISPGGRFQSGLLAMVVKHLKKEGYDIHLTGHPGSHTALDTLGEEVALATFSLRDYQVHGIHQSLKFRRGILEVATNGGKTALAAGLLKVLDIPPTLFVVPRKVLLHQSAEDLETYLGVKCGKIGDNLFQPNWDGITVAMYHTLSKRVKDKVVAKALSAIQVLLMDEIHFLSDSAFQTVADAVPAEFRLGLSGTPFRQIDAERLQTIGTTGPVLSRISNQHLIEQEISVRPNVCLLTPNVDDRYKGWDWTDAIWSNEHRNRLIAELAKGLVASGRQTMVMVAKVEHAKAIHKFFPEADITHSGSKHRKTTLQRLKDGEVFCTICTPIFNTGMSVPYIEGLIMASGGQSNITVLQSLGRAVRKAKDREKSLWVFDFMDEFNRVCKKHSKARLAIYEGQKAFLITSNLQDAPLEVQAAVDPTLVSSKNLAKPILALDDGRG